MSFAIGDTIGDYRVTGQLGRGGMGAVYKVQHLISDRVEAMKVVLPDTGAMDLDERFMREIRVQASLNHPGIAHLHNAMRHSNQLLMIMELIEGESLRDLVASGPLPVPMAVDYAAQVLDALDFAHRAGIVHRDIKPSNIIVTPQRRTKLLDFGLASMPRDRRITQTGLAVGSISYMSPEQVRGGAVDGRSDIYSFGVTFYEMLTGRLPIQGDSTASVLLGHLERVPVAPSFVNPAIPEPLSGAILRALEKDPSRRFQTAGEFRAALYEAPTRTISNSQRATFAWDAAVLDRITRELAHHIGPIARILVSRASAETTDYRDLCRRLAEEVPQSARAKFLSSLSAN